MAKNIVPTRMCSGCMIRRPKEELLRVVRNSDGIVFVDTSKKSEGRGAYVCPDAYCIKKAEKKNGFSRTLKTKVLPEIYDELLKLADGE